MRRKPVVGEASLKIKRRKPVVGEASLKIKKNKYLNNKSVTNININ